MKEKESDATAAPSSLRKEIWIHPDSGKRVHRTTSAVQEQKTLDSEEEDLASLSSVEVRDSLYYYVICYLYVCIVTVIVTFSSNCLNGCFEIELCSLWHNL